MGYRKVNPPIIVNFFDFMTECSLFKSGEEYTGQYICLSKGKLKEEKGDCLTTDCPLSYPASWDDLENFSDGLYAGEDPDDYSVLHRDVI